MNLNPENYYSKEADRHYMSVSQLKSFFQCEAAALAKLNSDYTEPENEALTLGSYVHTAIEGAQAMADFIQEHLEIICSTGKNKGELKAEYQHANRMIETLMTDDLCRQMLTGEKEVIITAQLGGVPWKAKLDVYAPDEGRFVDLKTVKAIREKYWVNGRPVSFIEAYDYLTQMAVYAELERLHSKRFDRLEPLIVAVSKEDVPDKAVICFDDETLQSALERVYARLPRVLAVKEGREEPERCETCRYCRKTKRVQGITHYMNLLEAN